MVSLCDASSSYPTIDPFEFGISLSEPSFIIYLPDQVHPELFIYLYKEVETVKLPTFLTPHSGLNL